MLINMIKEKFYLSAKRMAIVIVILSLAMPSSGFASDNNYRHIARETLSPVSKFCAMPKIVNIDKDRYVIIETRDKRPAYIAQADTFQNDTAFLYLGALIGEALRLDLSEPTLIDLIKTHLANIDFSSFDLRLMEKENGVFTVPYKRSDNGKRMSLKYSLVKPGETPPAGVVTINTIEGLKVAVDATNEDLQAPSAGFSVQEGESLIENGFNYNDPGQLRLAYEAVKARGFDVTWTEFKQKMDGLLKFEKEHRGYFKSLFTKDNRLKTVEISAKGAVTFEPDPKDREELARLARDLAARKEAFDSLAWIEKDFPDDKVFSVRSIYRAMLLNGAHLNIDAAYSGKLPADEMRRELLSEKNRKELYRVVFALARARFGHSDKDIRDRCVRLAMSAIVADALADKAMADQLLSEKAEVQAAAFQNLYRSYVDHLPREAGLKSARSDKLLSRAIDELSAAALGRIAGVSAAAPGRADAIRLVPANFLSVFRGRAGIADCSFDEDKGAPYTRALHEDTLYYLVYKGGELKGYVGMCLGNIEKGSFRNSSVLTIDTINSPALDGEELLTALFSKLQEEAQRLGCVGVALPGTGTSFYLAFNFNNADTIPEMEAYRRSFPIRVVPLHRRSWGEFEDVYGAVDGYNSIEYGDFVMLDPDMLKAPARPPDGSAYNMYHLLRSPQFSGRFVSASELAELTRGRAEGGHLSVKHTVLRDLRILERLGLLERASSDDNAVYRIADTRSEYQDVMEYILKDLPPRLKSGDLDNFQRKYRKVLAGQIDAADLISGKYVTRDKLYDAEDNLARSMISAVLPARGEPNYASIALLLVGALENDFEFSKDELARLKQLKDDMLVWRGRSFRKERLRLELGSVLVPILDVSRGGIKLKKKAGRSSVSIEKYILALGVIFEEGPVRGAMMAKPVIKNIVDAVFDEKHKEDISLTSPWRSYHLQADSSVTCWQQLAYFRYLSVGFPDSSPDRWQKMAYLHHPKGSEYKTRLREWPLQWSEDEAAKRKISIAFGIVEKKAVELERIGKAYFSAGSLEAMKNKITLIEVDSPLPLLFTDTVGNVVRPEYNGRSRQVAYIPKLFLSDLDEKSESDMRELAAHLFYILEWNKMHQEMLSSGAKAEKTHDALSALTEKFTKEDRYGLASPEQIRSRLYRLARQTLVAECVEAVPEAIDAYDRVRDTRRSLGSGFSKGYLYSEVGLGDAEDDARQKYVQLEEGLGAMVSFFDMLGMHDAALNFFEEQERCIRIIQSSDIGLLPAELQLKLVFFYLRHGDFDTFLKNLDMILTGKLFPERIARFARALGISVDELQKKQVEQMLAFIDHSMPYIERTIEEALASLKRVAPDQAARAEIDAVHEKAESMISRFTVLMRDGQLPLEPKSSGLFPAVFGNEEPNGIGYDIRLGAQDKKFLEKIGPEFKEAGKAIAQLREKGARRIVIWDPLPRFAGEELRTLPALVKAIADSWPEVEKISVVTPYPERINNLNIMGGRVKGIAIADFRVDDFSGEDRPDAVIDFTDTGTTPAVQGEISIPHMGRLFREALKKVYEQQDGEAMLTYPEAVCAILHGLGLAAPLPDDVLYVKARRDPMTVFINPHSVSNTKYFRDLKEAWVKLIVELVKVRGRRVILNAGVLKSADAENTAWIAREARKAIGNAPSAGSLEVFNGNMTDLFDVMPKAGGVITVDSSVNQLAHLYGMDYVVITTDNSRFWISEKDAARLAVPYKEFSKNASSVLNKLPVPADDVAPKPAPDRAADAASAAAYAESLSAKVQILKDTGTAAVPFVKDQPQWVTLFLDNVKLAAERARKEDRSVILAIETNGWIPEEQKALMQSVMAEIDNIDKYLLSLGLGNLKIIRGTGDGLASQILAAQGKFNASPKDVIVLATEKTVNSEAFSSLRSTETEDRAFLAAIDPADLTGLSYIRLFEMLIISLKTASGEAVAPADHPEIVIESLGRRMIRLMPKADPKDYNELKDIYDSQKKALAAA
jgi:hypothetical protein